MNHVEIVNNIRNGGKIISNLFNELENFIKPGISDYEIDNYCKDFFLLNNVVSGAFRYKGFPNYVCISINSIVCHGVCHGYIVKPGDIVSVDIVIKINGCFSDSCYTFIVGECPTRYKQLVKAAYETMWQTIQIIKPNVKVGDLGASMENIAEKSGFNVILDFCGHGIGTEMHKDPMIPFFGIAGTGKRLNAGDIITIEPMLVEKSPDINIWSDEWTAETIDKGCSAQFEHTVLITESGFEVLTFNDFDKSNNKPRIF